VFECCFDERCDGVKNIYIFVKFIFVVLQKSFKWWEIKHNIFCCPSDTINQKLRCNGAMHVYMYIHTFTYCHNTVATKNAIIQLTHLIYVNFNNLLINFVVWILSQQIIMIYSSENITEQKSFEKTPSIYDIMLVVHSRNLPICIRIYEI